MTHVYDEVKLDSPHACDDVKLDSPHACDDVNMDTPRACEEIHLNSSHAYDEVYLSVARTSLARMLDFAVYDMEYDITEFFDLFISSGVARRFETGDFHVLAGMSGIELAWLVLDESGIAYERKEPNFTANRSEEYWTGWALAYYQWETAFSFAEIISHVQIHEIQMLYYPYHEMDIRQFVDRMNELCEGRRQ